MAAEVGTYDVYNVYDACGTDPSVSRPAPFYVTEQGPVRTRWASRNYVSDATEMWQASRNPHELGGALNDYACGAERAMGVYLNNAAVQSAMHVIQAKHPQFNYTGTVSSLLPIYPALLADYQVLIYSGGSCHACWVLALPALTPHTAHRQRGQLCS